MQLVRPDIFTRVGLTTIPCLPRPPAMDSLPLVTCIMPTANRRTFVPQAIRYFLAQDYPNKELVIVDDGEKAVGDLVPEDERIRYIRLTCKTILGEKRNCAVAQ